MDGNITSLKLLKLSVDRKLLKPPKHKRWKTKLEPIREESSQQQQLFGQNADEESDIDLRRVHSEPFKGDDDLVDPSQSEPDQIQSNREK